MTRIYQSVASLTIGAFVALGCIHFGACTSAHADSGSAVVAGSGSAVAPPTAPVLDPTTDPGGAFSALQKLYHSGAWLCLGIVLAFFVLFAITKETHWLATGKRKAYAAAALGGLALLVVPALQGATPNLQMVIAALGTALALIVPPTAQKTASS